MAGSALADTLVGLISLFIPIKYHEHNTFGASVANGAIYGVRE
jgi:hypothetical protein